MTLGMRTVRCPTLTLSVDRLVAKWSSGRASLRTDKPGFRDGTRDDPPRHLLTYTPHQNGDRLYKTPRLGDTVYDGCAYHPLLSTTRADVGYALC